MFGLATGAPAPPVQHDASDVNNTNSNDTPSEATMHSAGNSTRLARRQGLNGRINTSTLFSDDQILAMQLTCCIIAGIALLLGIVICYWLARMKKVFRHRLIIMLMLADMLRSVWLFVFPVVSLAVDGIPSSSAFCQVSGFFSNASYDMADWIVLFIAINTALQVFKPHPVKSGHGGLYPYRYAVYAFVATVPFVLSALAFVNKSTVGAYLSQGPTCSLPIRPFWYRLALSWIPRYVIIILVLALYIAIYVHAERQFVDTRPFHRKLSAAVFVYPSTRSTAWFRWRPWQRHHKPAKKTTVSEANATFTTDGAFHDPPTSAMTLETPTDYGMTGSTTSPGKKVMGNSDSVDFAWSQAASARSSVVPPREEHDSRGDSAYTGSTLVTAATPTSPLPLLRLPQPLHQQQHQALTSAEIETPDLAWREMRKKHRQIRRQLRLQFVYPVIYFASWLAPFASHLSIYDASVARQPVFPLTLIGFASLALMGVVDFIVFSLRERPWRHIPGSDGTVLGSFVFWKTLARRRRDDDNVPDRNADSSVASSGLRRTTLTESSLESDGSTTANTAPGSRRPSSLRIATMVHPPRAAQAHGAKTASTGAPPGPSFADPGLGSPLAPIPSIDSVSSTAGRPKSPSPSTSPTQSQSRSAAAVPAPGAADSKGVEAGTGARVDAMHGLRTWGFARGHGGSNGTNMSSPHRQSQGLQQEAEEHERSGHDT